MIVHPGSTLGSCPPKTPSMDIDPSRDQILSSNLSLKLRAWAL